MTDPTTDERKLFDEIRLHLATGPLSTNQIAKQIGTARDEWQELRDRLFSLERAGLIRSEYHLPSTARDAERTWTLPESST